MSLLRRVVIQKDGNRNIPVYDKYDIMEESIMNKKELNTEDINYYKKELEKKDKEIIRLRQTLANIKNIINNERDTRHE